MDSMNLDWARPDPAAYANGFASAKIWRFKGGSVTEAEDCLIEEVPVELRFAGQEPIVMMATPLDIEDFALGFALTEGIVDRADQVRSIDAVPANGGFFVAIELVGDLAVRAASRRRNGPTASGCGVCGVAEISQALRLPAALPLGVRFAPDAIVKAVDAIAGLQDIGGRTGSAHGVGCAAPDGRILAFAEDAGRHNAMDKLVGACARLGLDPSACFCVATSRASYEMAQKAASARFPMLCAISGATRLAKDLAVACDLTLCAFARRGSFACLSMPQRLLA